MNEVTLRWAWLVLWWVTVFWADIPPRYVTKPSRSTQPCIPSESLNRVPALIGYLGAGNTVWSHMARNDEACCKLLYLVTLLLLQFAARLGRLQARLCYTFLVCHWSLFAVPYYCGMNNLTRTFRCVSHPDSINVSILVDQTMKFESEGLIDPTENMLNDQVYIYNGMNDTTHPLGLLAHSCIWSSFTWTTCYNGSNSPHHCRAWIVQSSDSVPWSPSWKNPRWQLEVVPERYTVTTVHVVHLIHGSLAHLSPCHKHLDQFSRFCRSHGRAAHTDTHCNNKLRLVLNNVHSNRKFKVNKLHIQSRTNFTTWHNVQADLTN